MRRILPLTAALLLTGCTASSAKEALTETRSHALVTQCSDVQTLLRTDPLCRTGLSAIRQHGHLLTFSYTLPRDALAAQKTELTAYAESWANSTAGLPPVQRVLLAHTRICGTCRYADSGASAHTAYGALICGQAVCEGYAEAFLLLCSAADIPCMIISGEADGRAHAWNLVQIGGAWYHVDCTWDDCRHDYGHFLCDDSTMRRTHSWDAGQYPHADAPPLDQRQIAAKMQNNAQKPESCIE